MEEFRELVLLLKNYSADEHIKVLDHAAIKQFPFWSTIEVFKKEPTNGNDNHAKMGSHGFEVPRQRLWNTLLFLDLTQEDTHDPHRVAYLCWQRLAVLKTLIAAGAIKSLRDIAESLLQTAKEYELTSIVIETAAQLRQFCALHDGNMSGFERYCQLIEQYEKILQAEQAAEDEYCIFLIQQNQAQQTAQSLANRAKEACSRLQPYAAVCHSSAFILNYYFLKLQVAYLEAEWESVVEISNQATQLLNRKSICSPAKISAFSLSKALGLANLGHLDQALQALAASIVEEPKGSLNWYRLQEMKLTWLLHQGNYNAALDLVKTLNQHNKYQEWPPVQRRLYNTVLLHLGDQGTLLISNRVKGILMVHCLPFRSLYQPDWAQGNLDAQATMLLLQMPKWIHQGASGKVAIWLTQYLDLSGACAPHARRLEALIVMLRGIEAGQRPQAAIENCLAMLKALPLDYTSPEASPEIMRIECILAHRIV